MKYQQGIIIDLPRERVIDLFNDPDNLAHWQNGFISLDPISGIPGEVGAQSRLQYQMGKRHIEMIETIIQIDLPNEFSATYESKGVWNKIHNYFVELSPTQTKWTSHNEFRFSSLFMKMMRWIMPSAFKKQSYQFMQAFKAFAENAA